jgi:hypothetical protein
MTYEVEHLIGPLDDVPKSYKFAWHESWGTLKNKTPDLTGQQLIDDLDIQVVLYKDELGRKSWWYLTNQQAELLIHEGKARSDLKEFVMKKKTTKEKNGTPVKLDNLYAKI